MMFIDTVDIVLLILRTIKIGNSNSPDYFPKLVGPSTL